MKKSVAASDCRITVYGAGTAANLGLVGEGGPNNVSGTLCRNCPRGALHKGCPRGCHGPLGGPCSVRVQMPAGVPSESLRVHVRVDANLALSTACTRRQGRSKSTFPHSPRGDSVPDDVRRMSVEMSKSKRAHKYTGECTAPGGRFPGQELAGQSGRQKAEGGLEETFPDAANDFCSQLSTFSS